MIRVPTRRSPTHPGEMLLEESLTPMGLGQSELADGIHLPCQQIDDIIQEPPKRFETLLIKGLAAGDDRFFRAAQFWYAWENDVSSEFHSAIETFQETEPTPEFTDDDVPF